MHYQRLLAFTPGFIIPGRAQLSALHAGELQRGYSNIRLKDNIGNFVDNPLITFRDQTLYRTMRK